MKTSPAPGLQKQSVRYEVLQGGQARFDALFLE